MLSVEEHSQQGEMFEERHVKMPKEGIEKAGHKEAHGVATQRKGRKVTTGVLRPWSEQQTCGMGEMEFMAAQGRVRARRHRKKQLQQGRAPRGVVLAGDQGSALGAQDRKQLGK